MTSGWLSSYLLSELFRYFDKLFSDAFVLNMQPILHHMTSGAPYIADTSTPPSRKYETIQKLLDSLIFSGRGRTCISDVWSAGRHMVQDGLHVEHERITKQFVKVSKQLGQEI